MEIKSPVFEHMESIPAKYTCQGEDISPPLRLTDVPAGCKSLALIVDDPDAPGDTWDHWIAWNIEPNHQFQENDPLEKAIHGTNSWGKLNYGGPCPPSGQHRYFFKVYALDQMLSLEEGASKEQLKEAMNGSILDSAELVGLYQKT